MAWTVFIDGGARGNPGPAGAGIEIQDGDGQVILAAGIFLGEATNNEAEYQALLHALRYLGQAEVDEVTLVSDSELMVKQLLGEYRVKAANLQPLFSEAQRSLLRLDQWQIQHVPRLRNQRADALANLAMDANNDVIEQDKLGLYTQQTSKKDGDANRFSQPSTDRSPSRSGRTNAVDRGGIAEVVVSVRKASKGCPLHHPKGKQFVFTAQVPAGLCVHACAAICDMVLALQSAAAEPSDMPIDPIEVSCPKPGCEAVFDLSVES
jgi:uncharacterized repeat protein (TIGR04076 family)